MLAAEQLLLGQRVVERRQSQRGHLTVGAGELELAPQLQVFGVEFVVGRKSHRDRHPGLGVFGRGWSASRGLARRPAGLPARVGLFTRSAQRRCSAGDKPDVDVGADRPGDLGAQVLTDRATGDPAEYLAENESVGGHVIALRGARFPPRFGGGQLPADEVPVGDVVPSAHPGARPDDTGSVAHHHGQGDVFLARLPELGPVAGDRRVQVQLTAVGKLVDAGGRQALGAGQHGGQGVLLPGAGAGYVSRAAPQVDDEVAVDPHRDGRADLVRASAKLRSNASRTPTKSGAHEPGCQHRSRSLMAPFCRANT